MDKIEDIDYEELIEKIKPVNGYYKLDDLILAMNCGKMNKNKRITITKNHFWGAAKILKELGYDW